MATNETNVLNGHVQETLLVKPASLEKLGFEETVTAVSSDSDSISSPRTLSGVYNWTLMVNYYFSLIDQNLENILAVKSSTPEELEARETRIAANLRNILEDLGEDPNRGIRDNWSLLLLLMFY